MDGATSWQVLIRIFIPSVVPAIVTVALFAFVTSWNEFLGALVMMSKGSTLHAAADPGGGPHRDQPRRHRLGDAPGRASRSRSSRASCVYLLLQRYYVSGLMSGAVK